MSVGCLDIQGDDLRERLEFGSHHIADIQAVREMKSP